ncbi:hypothetical protein MKW98_028908, partial [Papaver atlanticum]
KIKKKMIPFQHLPGLALVVMLLAPFPRTSLRSLKKKLKTKLSKEDSFGSTSSDSLNGEVSSKKNGNREMGKGLDSTVKCVENEKHKLHEELSDDGEDAASQTSHSKKNARIDNDNDDVIEMVKGLHEKLNVLLEKIKEF